MRIGLYLTIFPAIEEQLSCGYGIVKAVHTSATGLVACGAGVTVLCEGAEERTSMTSSGYEIRCFTNPSRPIAFRAGEELVRYLKGPTRPDLVVLNGIFDPRTYVVSRQLKKHGIPYVVAPHDPYHPAIFGTNAHLKWPYWYLMERRMLAEAEAVQVLDGRHERWLRRLGIKTPIVEITNGVAPEDVGKEGDLYWNDDAFSNFLFLGRLDAYNKGLDLLIDAFARVTPNAKARLVIQGPDDTNDKALLEARAASLSLSDQVAILNPDFTIPSASIIARHDVLCMPSRFEGFGLSALEAMLAGRVVMVSGMAGLAPHVEACGCGVVVEPDVASVQAGLEELLRLRPKWKEMGLRGRRHALEHLRHDRIAAEALELYRNLVASQEAAADTDVLR